MFCLVPLNRRRFNKYEMHLLHFCCLILINQVQTLSISNKNNQHQLTNSSQHQAPAGKSLSISQRHEKSVHDLASNAELPSLPLRQRGQQETSPYPEQLHHHHQPTTPVPPLIMTTVGGQLGNFVDTLAGMSKPLPYKPSVTEQQQQATASGNHRRSFNYNQMMPEEPLEDSDSDANPLQTVNNHSGGGLGAISKAPQYVDVSNLVARQSINAANFSSIQVSHHNVNSMNNYNSYNNNQSASNNQSLKSRVGLPECATQQVCNAIFVRMNYTQRLCECSGNYNWKCSNNLDPQDGHTIELTRKYDKRIYTQIKTCEPLREVRACKSPTDWTLLALQSERSGKAHYVVVCKCPTWAQLEGPYTHNHPPYANIPGIRVYGMLCAHQTARSSAAQTYSSYNPSLSIYPEFPWSEALSVANSTNLLTTLDS